MKKQCFLLKMYPLAMWVENSEITTVNAVLNLFQLQQQLNNIKNFVNLQYYLPYHMDERTSKNQKEIDTRTINPQNPSKAMKSYLSADSFSQPNYQHLPNSLRQYSQKLINFNQKSAEKYLEQALVSTINNHRNSKSMILMNEDINKPFREQQINQSQEGQQIIFIEKERQQQHDQQIVEQLKLARRKIYQESSSKFHKQLKKKQCELIFDNHLYNYNTFQDYEASLQREKRKCLPIVSIIDKKIRSLKVLHIEYQPQTYKYSYRYQVSAFDFFEVIHRNKSLTQATLKGVQIKLFDQFMRSIAVAYQSNSHTKEKSLQWMQEMTPSKDLKIAINAIIQFEIMKGRQTKSQMNSLIILMNLFCSLSDIKTKLTLGKVSENASLWQDSVSNLLKILQRILNIRIVVSDYWRQIKPEEAGVIRSVLFGGLACFTQIKSLAFQNMNFSAQCSVNDFLVIGQSLSAIFENNAVSNLQLNNCIRFPVFPEIPTLQSINIGFVYFWKEFHILNNLASSYPSLRVIKCKRIQQKWNIPPQMFDKLQFLMIKSCTGITLRDFTPQPPSKIKYLTIEDSQNSKIKSSDLINIFPKLLNLVQLIIKGINFSHQVLLTVPSTHLEELYLQGNQRMTGSGLRQIDKRWPKLRRLTLFNCNSIEGSAWNICEFNGLTEINIKSSRFAAKNNLQSLKGKGVRIVYY